VKPFKRDEKQGRQEYLKSKWGYENPGSNEALEHTHQDLLKYVAARWEALNPKQKAYFEAKRDWELDWQKRQIEPYHT